MGLKDKEKNASKTLFRVYLFTVNNQLRLDGRGPGGVRRAAAVIADVLQIEGFEG